MEQAVIPYHPSPCNSLATSRECTYDSLAPRGVGSLSGSGGTYVTGYPFQSAGKI